MASLTGSTIAHYSVAEQIGSGGMGEVYRAEDTRLKRQVALKFLPTSHRFDPERRGRLIQEARAACSLTSPHIVATYDLGEHQGAVFIIMEYVEGEDLARKLERGPLTVLEAIDITMQVADALGEAHHRGIVHRDIKSENLILTERGLVKILDFGLAKFVQPGGEGDQSEMVTSTMPPHTMTGVVLGTGSYMSPEQALGREIDQRSDIFSLGVVLYQMLSGRLPFEGKTITEVIDRIVHQPPPAVARFNYDVPEPLDKILRKTLEKDPNFRYQTARDLYIDLANLRRELESGQRPVTPAPANGATPVAPTAGDSPADELARAVAVIGFVNITKKAADDWIGEGLAETVAADLKQHHAVTLVGRERVVEALKGVRLPDTEANDDALGIAAGRRLGVAWIVTGGYQKLDDAIRITARLVDVRTGGVLNVVKVDGSASEIFIVQDRIAQDLMKDLDLGSGELTGRNEG